MMTSMLGATVFGLAALVLATQARGAEPISGKLTANPTGEVSIIVTRGWVKVVGVDGDEVTVEGTRDHQSEAFIFERSGDVVQIEDRLPRHTSNGPGTQLTVQVPRGSRVRALLVSADLDVTAVTGAARLSTVSGSITARTLGEEAELSSVSGDIVVTDAGGEVRVDTISGDIEAQTRAARISAKTVSGTIEIENTQALARGRLVSVSGDLSLTTPVQSEVEIEAETVSGDATLTLGGELDLRLDVIGGPSGTINNDLDDTPVQRGGHGGGERLEGRFGGGRGYVRVSTVSGTLTLSGD